MTGRRHQHGAGCTTEFLTLSPAELHFGQKPRPECSQCLCTTRDPTRIRKVVIDWGVSKCMPDNNLAGEDACFTTQWFFLKKNCMYYHEQVSSKAHAEKCAFSVWIFRFLLKSGKVEIEGKSLATIRTFAPTHDHMSLFCLTRMVKVVSLRMVLTCETRSLRGMDYDAPSDTWRDHPKSLARQHVGWASRDRDTRNNRCVCDRPKPYNVASRFDMTPLATASSIPRRRATRQLYSPLTPVVGALLKDGYRPVSRRERLLRFDRSSFG